LSSQEKRENFEENKSVIEYPERKMITAGAEDPRRLRKKENNITDFHKR
jgi:hypothetical protein